MQFFFFQLIDLGFKKWRGSYWNWWDVIAIVLYFVGFVIRMANQRIEGRIVYAIDLMFFIVRILETFLVDEDIGPYVVMIGRMVSNKITSESTYQILIHFKPMLYFSSKLPSILKKCCIALKRRRELS